jgi:hypothetical protein
VGVVDDEGPQPLLEQVGVLPPGLPFTIDTMDVAVWMLQFSARTGTSANA